MEARGAGQQAIKIIQVRDNGGSDKSVNSEGGEKLSNSGYNWKEMYAGLAN